MSPGTATKASRPRTDASASRGSTPLPTLDPLAAKLATVGLDHPASCLPELIEEATREGLSATAFLDLILTRQLERKDERRVQTMLKLSGLPRARRWRTSTGPSSRASIAGRSRPWPPAATSATRPTCCFWGRRGWGKATSRPRSA
jgi:hypothetical protein